MNLLRGWVDVDDRCKRECEVEEGRVELRSQNMSGNAGRLNFVPGVSRASEHSRLEQGVRG